MPKRCRMNSTMGQTEQEHPELFSLEFGKIASYDFVNTLESTNILTKQHQSCSKCMCHKISDEFNHGSNRTRTVLSYLQLNLQKLQKLTLFTP